MIHTADRPLAEDVNLDGLAAETDGVVYPSGLNTMEASAGVDGDLLWRYGIDASGGSGTKVAPAVGGAVFLPSARVHALRGADASP